MLDAKHAARRPFGRQSPAACPEPVEGSSARIVRRFLLCKTRWLKKDTVTNMPLIFQNSKQADES
jgi:hypothetical protein